MILQHPLNELRSLDDKPLTPGTEVKHEDDARSYGVIIAQDDVSASVMWKSRPQQTIKWPPNVKFGQPEITPEEAAARYALGEILNYDIETDLKTGKTKVSNIKWLRDPNVQEVKMRMVQSRDGNYQVTFDDLEAFQPGDVTRHR